MAIALDGDTILVDAGHYREHTLIITKRVTLKGIQYPVIDGEKKYEIIAVKADGVVIDGFRVVHSGVSSLDDISGIKIYDRKNVVIKNNILEDTFFGIYTQNGTNCVIQNNQITAYSKEEQQSGNGIHCWKSDSMQIIGNSISGHRDGIYFEFVTHSVIWRNQSGKNMRYGLHFMFSHNDSYMGNNFRNNGAGVSVMYSHGVKMLNNVFEENWGDGAYGLLLKEITDSYIEGNSFVRNTSGIYMEGASRITMQKNLFKDNGWAMKIQASCMAINVSKNNFIGNTFDVGTNGTLVLNTFDNNYWDKYDGYDLNKDRIGDIPYRPVSMYSMIVEKNPSAMLLFRSFFASLLDKTEKIIPSLTPEMLKDNKPMMKKIF
ncbi:MAG: nitrous oxide reductase family maturation protein NosD [Bacteroidota bacterium]